MDTQKLKTSPLYEGTDLEALTNMRRYRELITSYFRPYLAGEAIEIGAGIGSMAYHITPHVRSLQLVEPSPNLIETLKARFADHEKVSVINKDFNQIIFTAQDKSFDCVILVNVLEHIEDDELALKECFRILRPGGKLLLFVPALPFLYSNLDKIVGHFRRYTKSDFLGKVGCVGFRIELARYFDFLGMFPWFLLNTIGGATKFNPALLGIYDKFFVPLTSWIEARFKIQIGKNLIAVLERPQERRDIEMQLDGAKNKVSGG